MDSRDTNNLSMTTEFEVLTSFHSHSGLALSVYLDLRSTRRREKALETVRLLIHRHLRNTQHSEEDWEILQEDIDLIQMYLRTNGNRQAVGVALFSCAQELFWRAYPIWAPIKTEVHIGTRLNTRQLMEVLERAAEPSVA